jgi:hypothetical protein
MGEEPPCEECSYTRLSERNRLAWQIWSNLHEFERPRQAGMSGMLPLPIPVTSMASYTHTMGGDERDLEKVQLIERKMLPWIREQESSCA